MSKEEEIEMLKEKLDYYTLVATDEEFDAEEVIKIVKRLEELEPTEAPEKSVDEFLDDFWKYCEERERGCHPDQWYLRMASTGTKQGVCIDVIL